MKSINCKGKILTLDEVRIMGTVNCTPDSIYNNIGNQSVNAILRFVEKMIQEGVDILDIGGYSTRPKAIFIEEEEELRRILPIIEKIHTTFPEILISVDTFRAKVAQSAIASGASIVNDISGACEPEIISICATQKVPYVLMHIKGAPHQMMENVQYQNVVTEVYRYLSEKIQNIQQEGVNDILIDLGFGFSKNLNHNYQLLKNLDFFGSLNRPILVGISRKSMIKSLLDIEAENALNGTSVLNSFALGKGANILRVHDVKEAVEIKKIYQKLAEV
jgi:dihydropteroate synthase